MDTTARLVVTCPDRPGIVATVTNFLYNHGANITALDQHSTDPEGGTFFMRLEFQTPHLDVGRAALEQTFGEVVAARFDMQWRLHFTSERYKLAILCTRAEHALLELLWRWRRGELPCDVTMVISNHEVLRRAAEEFGVPFHHVPIDRAHKEQAEETMLSLLDGHADVIALARYMQILSPRFVERYRHRIVNIHHSFLPAFAGAQPYRQAFERGVKLIGATAHYVTEELDAGPIIAQDVLPVSHRHSVEDLKALGRDIERRVLARAVQWHIEDRIVVHGNKTVVFA